MEKRKKQQGEVIKEVIAELAFRAQLKKLAEERERRKAHKGRKRNVL